MIKIIQYFIFIISVLLALLIGAKYSKFIMGKKQNEVEINIPAKKSQEEFQKEQMETQLENKVNEKRKSPSLDFEEEVSKDGSVLTINGLKDSSKEKEDITEEINKIKESVINNQTNEKNLKKSSAPKNVDMNEDIIEEKVIQETEEISEEGLEPEEIQESIQEESLEPEEVLKPEEIQEIPEEEIMIEEEPPSIEDESFPVENEIENNI